MGKDCTSVKVEEEEEEEQDQVEDEIELSLELSVGGRSYRKSNPLHQKSMDSCCSKMGFHDFTKENQSFPRSVLSHLLSVRDLDHPAMDPQSKREIQSLRRQEARKKKEEKLTIKALSRGMMMNGNICGSVNEEDVIVQEPPRKKEKNETFQELNGIPNQELIGKDVNLTLNHHNQNHGSNPMVPPVGQMPCPYPPALQYVPFTHGVVYPYGMMPSWGPVAVSNGGNEGQREKKVLFEPTACRSFRPYNGNRNFEQNGNGSKDNGGGGNGKDGSPGCSSYAVSDYQSSSRQGGNSNDTGSNWSNFPQENLNASSAGDRPEQQSDNKSDSEWMEYSNEATDKATANCTVNVVSSTIPQSTQAKCSEEPKSEAQADNPVNKPITTTTQNPVPPAPLKEETTNGTVIGKPPKPQTKCQGTPSLPKMPCVSTTGNGANGKTITGFLYRYTNAEVSIVCVCHGTSFSPAEFVEHAGGIDVAHPLRHITMVPSALA